jgi:hypothetical protein
MGLDYTKDFEIVELKLTTATGETIDLKFKLIELNVFEDIWNNQTTGNLVINDAQNMLMNGPIFGYETLDVAFRTPGLTLYRKQFRVIRVTDQEQGKDRELFYTIHFVTPEAVINLTQRVSKSYKSKKISDIVTDIHTTYLGGAIDAEDTKYQHHVIIPMINPCHAINWLCTRANSSSYEGANYLYYEDKDTFRFVSMESRLEQPTVKKYGQQVSNVRKDNVVGHRPQELELNVLSIEKYKFANQSDILENIQSGMYGNELLTHSHTRKLWKRYTFDYPTSFDNYKHLHPGNKLYSDSKGNIATKDSRLKLHSTGYDLDGYPFVPEQWIPVRISQLQQLQNIRLIVSIPGDSERTIGQVVEMELPSPESPVKKEQVKDKYYRGRFLIQSLRHRINQDAYYTDMELVKDSTYQKYP